MAPVQDQAPVRAGRSRGHFRRRFFVREQADSGELFQPGVGELVDHRTSSLDREERILGAPHELDRHIDPAMNWRPFASPGAPPAAANDVKRQPGLAGSVLIKPMARIRGSPAKAWRAIMPPLS
jgi:hypothetical protein